MPRAAKMTQLNIEETSGVDHPAHLREGWLVVKSRETSSIPAILDRIVKENTDMPDKTGDELREELDKAYGRIAELEDTLKRYRKADGGEMEDDEDEEVEEEFMKAAPAAVVRAFEKARKDRAEALQKAAEAEAALRSEREAKADAEAIEKARGWSNLSVDAETVGPALRRVAEFDEELAKSLNAMLDSVNAQAESANIFAEIGKSASAPVEQDAYSRMSALAKAAVESGRAATVEQAMVDIAVSNPDLYMDYLSQKGA